MGEVTERATQKATARNGGDASGPDRKGGGGAALVRSAPQRRNFCKSCLPARYQRRAGLWFSRSRNPALTAGLFFDKQDASIWGCQHPRLFERKEVERPHPKRQGPRSVSRGFPEKWKLCRCSRWDSIKKGRVEGQGATGGGEARTLPPHETDSTAPSLQAFWGREANFLGTAWRREI